MNEVVIHRGHEPHLASIDVYINDEWTTNALVRFFFLKKKKKINFSCVCRQMGLSLQRQRVPPRTHSLRADPSSTRQSRASCLRQYVLALSHSGPPSLHQMPKSF